LVKTVERIPKKHFDHITGSNGIYEIRVEYNSNIFRIFSFFDEGQLIILMNGFHKKSPKTPKEEIEKAEVIKEEYFIDKEKLNTANKKNR
jgi:phage-related protein